VAGGRWPVAGGRLTLRRGRTTLAPETREGSTTMEREIKISAWNARIEDVEQFWHTCMPMSILLVDVNVGPHCETKEEVLCLN
jgi:hypothetical protein